MYELPEELREGVEGVLRNKPVRTMSGVAPVAVVTSPYDCPHGRCIYCPGGVANNTPQSYTGKEPAARRAEMHGYDPFRQTRARIDQLNAIGHRTDKVDLIIMGGTFTSRPIEYQDWFVKRCFDAMNGSESSDLAAAHTANETAPARCVGLTVETRPDWFGSEQLAHSLALGATRNQPTPGCRQRRGSPRLSSALGCLSASAPPLCPSPSSGPPIGLPRRRG